MIEDHNLSIPEQDYRDMDIPSYSLLSSISKHGIDVLSGVKGNFFQLKFGSLVDDLCFEPSNLANYYEAKGVKTITGNPKIIIDSILDSIADVSVGQKAPVKQGLIPMRSPKKKVVSNSISDYRTEIISTARTLGVYKNYNDDKIFNTIIGKSDNINYFADKINSRGKVHIKPEMWQMAIDAATTLKTHDFTRIYFDDTPGIQLIYQYKFVQKVNGYDVKGMLDCLVIDHDNKTIYPVDLKTGEESVENFDEVMLLHKYYLQASLYRSAIKAIVAKDPDLKGYSVSNFEFVYLSKMNIFKPLIWVVPQTLHKAGWDGFTDRFGFKHKGLTELLEAYKYSKANALCNYAQTDYENDGRKFLSNLIKIEEE